MNFFAYESRFSQALLKLTWSCWLNLLWLICSLPVFTAGASTAALYSVMLKIADGKESTLTKAFFASFRRNFRQATKLWLLMLGAGIVLAADGWIAYHMRASSTGVPAVLWTLNLALLIAAGVVYTVVLIWLFPLIARYANTDMAMLKNSLLIGLRYLFCTIMVFAIHFAMFFAVVALFTPLIIFGEGLCALLSSGMMIQVFRIMSYQEEE